MSTPLSGAQKLHVIAGLSVAAEEDLRLHCWLVRLAEQVVTIKEGMEPWPKTRQTTNNIIYIYHMNALHLISTACC